MTRRSDPVLVRSRSDERAGSGALGRGRLAYLVAEDPAGDRLAADLMRALGAQAPGLRLTGVGGRAMQAAALAPLFEMDELGAGPLPRRLRVLRGAERIARDVLLSAPDVLVTIEGPGGLGRATARRVRRRRPGLPILHYGLPPIGARGSAALRQMARSVDRVLALLPFECPPLEEAGVACDFVGHPIAERPAVAREVAARYRAELGIRPDRRLVLLAPGSTRAEVRRHLPLFRRCIEKLAVDRPGLGAVVAVAPGLAGAVEAGLRGMRPAPHLVRPEAGGEQRWRAMTAADAALTASGAVTLELAAAGTPMIVCRRGNPLIAALARTGPPAGTAALVNLVAGMPAVPELHGRECRLETVEPALAELLDDEDARMRQLVALEAAMTVLGRGGEPPSAKAARSVLSAIAGAQRPGKPAAVAGQGPGGSRD